MSEPPLRSIHEGWGLTHHSKTFPEFFLTAPQECPYLPDRAERKIFTHLSPGQPCSFVDGLLRGGFRRSQSIAYMPYCQDCSACISVRVVVDEFRETRSMRRVRRANSDLDRIDRSPSPNSEQYDLFRSYLDERHADGGMADMSWLEYAMMVEDSMVETSVVEYRVRPRSYLAEPNPDRPLMAAALSDQLSDGLSMVYSFFDPAASGRSLGTFMILDHIDRARKLGLPYVYLGYWIEQAPKMRYKSRFQPQEHLIGKGWRRV